MELAYFIFATGAVISLTGCLLKSLSFFKDNVQMSIRGLTLATSGFILTNFSIVLSLFMLKHDIFIIKVSPFLLGGILGLTISTFLIPKAVMGEKRKDNVLSLLFFLTMAETAYTIGIELSLW